MVTGQRILLLTFQSRLGEASQLAQGLKSFCGAGWASHVDLANGEQREQRDESPPSCACRGRGRGCEIITVGARPLASESVRQQQAWRRRMKGDSAQSGVLRRGMCARQAPPWAATDMMLCYDAPGRGPCKLQVATASCRAPLGRVHDGRVMVTATAIVTGTGTDDTGGRFI